MVDRENEKVIAAAAANLCVTEDSLTAINVAHEGELSLGMRVEQLLVGVVAMTGVLLGETPAPTIKAPRILERVEPQYTNEARAAGIEGTVTLRAELDENGRLSSITVFKGLGHGLDENAISCARQWRFEPAMRDGVRIEVRVGLDINFRLPPHP